MLSPKGVGGPGLYISLPRPPPPPPPFFVRARLCSGETRRFCRRRREVVLFPAGRGMLAQLAQRRENVGGVGCGREEREGRVLPRRLPAAASRARTRVRGSATNTLYLQSRARTRQKRYVPERRARTRSNCRGIEARRVLVARHVGLARIERLFLTRDVRLKCGLRRRKMRALDRLARSASGVCICTCVLVLVKQGK